MIIRHYGAPLTLTEALSSVMPTTPTVSPQATPAVRQPAPSPTQPTRVPPPPPPPVRQPPAAPPPAASSSPPASGGGIGLLLAGAGMGFLVGGPLGALIGGGAAAFLKK